LVLASFNCWCVIQKSFHPLYETIVFGNPDPMQLKIKPVLFYFWIGCGFTARCAKSARSKASAICSVTLIVMAQTHAGYL